MPIGIIVNSLATLLGGITGTVFSSIIPDRLKKSLPVVFGFSAVALGISKIIEGNNITVIILSIVIGFIIGEIVNVDAFFEKMVNLSIARIVKLRVIKEASTDVIIMAVLIFCFSGTGIFGALKEGLSQDSTVLLSKSGMDFFTAVIFASLTGITIAFISIPQFMIMILLYSIAVTSSPELTEYSLGNFAAVGGIITMMMGFKMAEITNIKVANSLPSLLLVIIISRFL